MTLSFKREKVKKRIRGMLLLCVILVAGCRKQDQPISDQRFDMSECISSCKTIQTQEPPQADPLSDCESLCSLGQAIQSGDPSACEDGKQILRDPCYAGLAYEYQEVSLCQKIQESSIRNGCYTNLAEKLGDATICQNIQDTLAKSTCEIASPAKE